MDPAFGEFGEDLVGGEFGVEHEQARVLAGDLLPVVGEGDHLACLFGFGQLGVGVDHFLRGVVVGEERQHRAGPLRAGRDVVVLQRDVDAVVADGVEVEVEPLLACGEPELAQASGDRCEQLLAA